jgi:hypothetical protein
MTIHSPFDALTPILRAAQKVGPTAWGPITHVEITFAGGTKIPFEVGKLWASEPKDEFEPNAAQRKMLRFLIAGPKSPTQLRNHVGAHLYDAVGGIAELTEVGWVSKKLGKFQLSDVGKVVAAELGDEEDSDG